MQRGLLMHDDQVGSRLGKVRDMEFWTHDHQVGFDQQRRDAPHGGDDTRAHRNIGHVSAVHHVYLQPPRARRFDLAHLIAQPREVGGEDRGANFDLHRITHRSDPAAA